MAVSPVPTSELKTAALSVAVSSVPPPRLKPVEGTSSKIDARVAELQMKRAELIQGGGKQRIDKQHSMGKLTARERVDKLVDRASFQEIGIFAKHRATLFGMSEKETPADGVVTGCATVEGRLVHLASQDFTVCGGTAGEMHCDKITEMMQLSLKTGSPFIFINDSGGARVQEGIDSPVGLRQRVLQQRPAFRQRPADFHDLWTMRRRRGLQSGADRLHHSNQKGADVYHRAAGDQAGNGRSGDERRSGGTCGPDESFRRGSPDR